MTAHNSLSLANIKEAKNLLTLIAIYIYTLQMNFEVFFFLHSEFCYLFTLCIRVDCVANYTSLTRFRDVSAGHICTAK